MTYFNDAKVLDALQLKEIIQTRHQNPTVEPLVFVEARVKDGAPSRIFPCYLEAWAEDPAGTPVGKEKRKPLMFRCTVIQYRRRKFSMLQIEIHEEEFETRKRIWDRPPAESLRKYLPMVDGVLQ